MPVLSGASRKDALFLLEGETRPVRISPEGKIRRLGGDDLVFAVGRGPLDHGFQYVREGKSIEPSGFPLASSRRFAPALKSSWPAWIASSVPLPLCNPASRCHRLALTRPPAHLARSPRAKFPK